jgi:hypothetical protein
METNPIGLIEFKKTIAGQGFPIGDNQRGFRELRPEENAEREGGEEEEGFMGHYILRVNDFQ